MGLGRLPAGQASTASLGMTMMSGMVEAALIHFDARGSRVLLRHPLAIRGGAAVSADEHRRQTDGSYRRAPLRRQDSNLDHRNQNPRCCLYTTADRTPPVTDRYDHPVTQGGTRGSPDTRVRAERVSV